MWNDTPYIQSFWSGASHDQDIKRSVEALEPQDRDVDHFDEDLKGFGVRVRPSGHQTYFVMMRHRCVMRRFTIGSHGAVTAEAARLKAKQIISDLAIDKNPTEVEGPSAILLQSVH